jgi:hypothetical protein
MSASVTGAGKHERGDHCVAATRCAVSAVFVAGHLSRVIAALRHADGWTQAVSGRCFQELLDALVTLEIAELHQLLGLLGENNGRHLLLLATGARIIWAPDSGAELLEHSYCSFRMPSVLAKSATTLRRAKERLALGCTGAVSENRRGILPNWQMKQKMICCLKWPTPPLTLSSKLTDAVRSRQV